ncbi:MAG: NUDIX domain-containing protein [Patescibacteria group bacterium]|nr:NUDIX domain-containing protein [Patescibacteria group bacterium]MDE2015809.1 NUDIX domain-containing protein [Patescibacteria group bacterium]MDE2227184.1 NUDIX domain-containing protein [Patescibacteria group bacterium]
MEETIDRVDLNDKVIGLTTVRESHEKAYIHRVAAVYVFTPDRELIIQKRKDNGLLDHSAAGHVASGESYEIAAGRELQEELGIVPLRIQELGLLYADERLPSRNHPQVRHYFGIFICDISLEEFNNIKIQEGEVGKVIRMSLGEIIDRMRRNPLDFSPGFIFTINFYIKDRKLDIGSVSII